MSLATMFRAPTGLGRGNGTCARVTMKGNKAYHVEVLSVSSLGCCCLIVSAVWVGPERLLARDGARHVHDTEYSD
jgi:hypothetical protein